MYDARARLVVDNSRPSDGIVRDEGPFEKPVNSEIDFASITKYLQLDLFTPSTATRGDFISYGDGDIYLDMDEVGTYDVRGAGSADPTNGEYALNLTGTASTNASTGVMYLRPGQGNSVSVAGNAGESMEVNSITVYSGTVSIGGSVTTGDGASAVPVTAKGGAVTQKSSGTTFTLTGGSATREGSGTLAKLDIEGGVFYDNGSGTINSTNIYATGRMDMSQNTAGVTHSQVDIWKNSAYLDPHKKATRTNGLDLNKCKLSEVTVDLGTDFKITTGSVD